NAKVSLQALPSSSGQRFTPVKDFLHHAPDTMPFLLEKAHHVVCGAYERVDLQMDYSVGNFLIIVNHAHGYHLGTHHFQYGPEADEAAVNVAGEEQVHD